MRAVNRVDRDAPQAHHGRMELDSSGGRWSDLSALPEEYREAARVADAAAFTLEVDGETFVLRPAENGGTHYAWVRGRNEDYGFSVSLGHGAPLDEHRVAIRSFLALVDPTTGYIEAD
jgi:hypothetical protein